MNRMLFRFFLVILTVLTATLTYAQTIIFEDDFSSGEDWLTKPNITIEQNKLVLFSKNAAVMNWVETDLSDGEISVDVWVNGSGDTWFGLIYRVQDDRNYYYTYFNHDGGFNCGKVVDGYVTYLKDPLTRVRGLSERGPTRLRLKLSGQETKIYINDRFITAFEDEEFTSGGVGFYTQMETRAVFDNLIVSKDD